MAFTRTILTVAAGAILVLAGCSSTSGDDQNATRDTQSLCAAHGWKPRAD